MDAPIRVLMITSAWPTPGQPRTTHFIKRQADFLRAAGVDVDVFHFQGRRRIHAYLLAWARVQWRLIRRRYDVVHAQWGQSGLLALPKRRPLVVTFRGFDLHGVLGSHGRRTLAGALLRSLSRLVARRADAVILVSEHMRRSIATPAPVHIIPSGLDLELFRPSPQDEARRRLGLPAGTRLVLFAGDPAVPRKRYALAQEAVRLLERDHSVAATLVVAWGVSHTEMPLYMSACDALVLTSLEEGSPNVVKEALACDLPVVSVPVGDVAERLRGIAGCETCPDDRPETLAAALQRVLARRQRIAGRAAVIDLDENLLTQRVIAIYRSVMSQRREQPGELKAHGAVGDLR